MKRFNRMRQNFTAVVATIAIGCFSLTALASPLDETIRSQQQQWANANYQLEGDLQEKAFEKLIAEADKATKTFPDSAQSWIWSGIIKSSFAGAKGGLGALSLVKAAKSDLEKALKLDGEALGGSAYASLGLLYHKVPGWPIAFGSDKKAEKLLKQALKINPNGKESNFFYGEFLYDERKYQQAKKYLLAAQNAPQIEGRPVAYKFRQKEIAAVLAKVENRLAKRKRR